MLKTNISEQQINFKKDWLDVVIMSDNESSAIGRGLIHPLRTSLMSLRMSHNSLISNLSSSDCESVDGDDKRSRRRSSTMRQFSSAIRKMSASFPGISKLLPFGHEDGYNSSCESAGFTKTNISCSNRRRLLHQAHLRAKSFSPLRMGKSLGQLSGGSSYGDLMNSGEFRIRPLSARCCSPIALSMVKSIRIEESTDSVFINGDVERYPTISVESPDEESVELISRAFKKTEYLQHFKEISRAVSKDSIASMNKFGLKRPPFVAEDGSYFGELSPGERKELHEYLILKQRYLAQKALVNIHSLF